MPVWERVLREVMVKHRGKLAGAVAGFVVALLVISLGFLKSLFVVFCVAAGYLVGRRLDSTHEDILDILDRILPPGDR